MDAGDGEGDFEGGGEFGGDCELGGGFGAEAVIDAEAEDAVADAFSEEGEDVEERG